MSIPRRVIFYVWVALVWTMLCLIWPGALSAKLGQPWLEQSAAYGIAHTTPFTTPITNQLFLPWVAGPIPGQLVIAAAHIDSVISGEGDEAILLWNIGEGTQPLAGWQLATSNRQATFPITSTLRLAPGERLWCAATAATFRLSFGEVPGCEWASDSDPSVLNLDGKLALTNSGGHLYLRNPAGELMDTLIYGNNAQPAAGWQGVAAQIYARGDVPVSGQVWQRKRDPVTGWPLDSDRASDWAGDLADLVWGRQVRMPGWTGWTPTDLDRPQSGMANANVTIAIGPEGLYQPLAALLASATTSLDLSLYTLEHRELAQVIADTARRGVQVRLLLEGSPPGGISDLQKWGVAEIAGAGGQVRYLAVVADAPNGYRPRYRFLHAKYGIIDGQRVFNGTENFNYDAMPVESSVPVGGRRGFYLITDAVPVLQALQRLFTIDWVPDRFLDLQPFDPAHAKYGGPPADFVFPEWPVYGVTAAPFRDSVTVNATAQFTVVSVPENAMRLDSGLNALLAQAGAGDEILVTQLYEHKNWGDSVSNPVADPNPRVQAMVAAARRGTRVRILLDSFFDDAEALRSNQATITYLRELAAAEGLDLDARVGNPTLAGIHAKVVLVRLGDARWSAVGSLNGSEISHKLNREVVVITDVAAVYARLAEVFAWDWEISEE